MTAGVNNDVEPTQKMQDEARSDVVTIGNTIMVRTHQENTLAVVHACKLCACMCVCVHTRTNSEGCRCGTACLLHCRRIPAASFPVAAQPCHVSVFQLLLYHLLQLRASYHELQLQRRP